MKTQEQQSQQSQQPQQQSTTAEAMGSHDDDNHGSSASSDVEATMREMAQAQRKRQAELHRQAPTWSTQYQHHRRCGQCDDCMKGLPCLVASVDAEQPGAFTVTSSLTTARVHRVEFHGSGNTLTTVGTGGPGPHQSSCSSLPSIGESHSQQQRRPSSPLATAAVAAVVVTGNGSTTEEEQEQRELELAQHEAQLAQREAQLRAWQADLERQRQQLTAEQEQHQAQQQQQQQRFSERTTTRPSTSVVVAVPEETIERNELGPGPMRFAPNNSMRSSQAQVMGLDRNMVLALQEVEQKWNQRQLKLARHGSNGNAAVFQLSPQWHMRFLWFYAKPVLAVTKRRRNSTAVLMASDDGTSATSCSHQVNMKKVWAAEKKLQKRFVTLNVATLGPQLYSKTLFPVPGLKTKEGHSMFYMRPSRYFPKHTSTKTIIDNLVYVMNCMLENSQHAQQHGIGFIACMDSWKMVNFDISYCYAFMMALQGVMVPVKTQLFLIVNPPSWFGAIWKLMKPMLVPSFQRKVKIVPESKIHKYLAPGYEQYLPDDMQTGKANTDAMVVDFVAYRQYVEQGQAVEYHTLNHHQHQHYQYETSTVGGESSTGDGDGTEVSYEEDPYYYRHDACHSSGGPSEHTDSSLHDSIGNLTGAMSIPTVTSSSGYDMCEDDDENASIHCDIDNEDELDEADMKPASSEEIFISNMPRFRER